MRTTNPLVTRIGGRVQKKGISESENVIGKDQCKELQRFIMSIETAKNLGGLFELTTAGR